MVSQMKERSKLIDIERHVRAFEDILYGFEEPLVGGTPI